jgi:hypothetical protein
MKSSSLLNRDFRQISANGLWLGEGCQTYARISHKTFWQLLPNRCYVLGGLSALNLIKKRNGKKKSI